MCGGVKCGVGHSHVLTAMCRGWVLNVVWGHSHVLVAMCGGGV